MSVAAESIVTPHFAGVHILDLSFILHQTATHIPTFTMNTDWDSKTVIGFKAKTPTTVRKESDLNGKRHHSHHQDRRLTPPIAARRSGVKVDTDKKISAGANKAHVGMSET